MARPRTDKITAVKAKIVSRLQHGFYRPGDRFLSTRAVAAQFAVSYQTADRLIRELAGEGLLERRPASGTYVPGTPDPFDGVCLMFHPRGRRPASFGSRLHADLLAALTRERLQVDVKWITARGVLPAVQWLPILWESDAALAATLRARRPAILINALPPSGLDTLFIDSIAVDDFAGGAMAADLLSARLRGAGGKLRFTILAGPREDPRSNARLAGFKARHPAMVVAAETWFFEAGHQVAGQVMASRPSGVFCCNDRLAEALLAWCRTHHATPPAVVGFDDAPIAETLNLTTIAIPWGELSRAVFAAVERRRNFPTAPAVRQVLSPRPMIRW